MPGDMAEPDTACIIPALDADERQMLREFARSIRERPDRSHIAQDALEAVAIRLERAERIMPSV